MKRPLSTALLLVLLLGLSAGCSSIASRIQEKSATFAALDAATQAKIQHGRVELGFTPDMVYMALGQPDETRVKTTSQATRTIWIYTSTNHEYAGTTEMGYRRVFMRDPRTGNVYVYLEPVYGDVYRERVQEDIRIVFEHGRVAVIEQAKP